MKIHKLTSIMLILSILVITLAACSSSGGNETSSGLSTATPALSQATTVGATPTPQPTPTPLPASIEVTSLLLTPGKVAVEEEATAIVSLKNTGGVSGNYTVELKIEGVSAQKKDIVVGPQSSKKVRFQISKEKAGIYQVSVDGFQSTLKVSPGFYRSSAFGFTIEFPIDWVVDETESAITIKEPDEGTQLIIMLGVLTEEMSLEEYATEFIEQIRGILSTFAIVSQGSSTVGNSIPAYDFVFTASSSGYPTKGEAQIVFNGTKVIILWRHYVSTSFDLVKNTLDSIVQKFRLEEPTLFGIPRSEALFLYDTGPLTLDPTMCRETASAFYVYQIFSGLVTFDQNLQIVPDMAESWNITGDGTIYTFHLRKDATFHSGRQVTANDFKYSLERACDPDTDSPTAATYLSDIVGVTEKLNGEASDISGVKVMDDYTLQITIDSAKSYFLQKLAHPVSFVVDRYDVESGEDWWETPNGTGAFSLMEWEEDELVILERNSDFYDTPSKVEYVVFSLWGGYPMIMYETGEIDSTGVYLDDLDRVLDSTNPLNEELVTVPQLSVAYIGFNSTKPPFNDSKVRQAFSYAIDKDKIVDVIFKDSVVSADGILPPGLPGYSASLQGLGYDPVKAKQLIAESSYGSVSNLPPITLTTSGRGTVSDLETALIDMWHDNLGVEVDVRQLDPENYHNLLMEEKDELFTVGWSADYPDPQDFLDILFHTGSEENTGEYSNASVDSLLEQARVEQSNAVRMQMYQQAEQMLIDDAACLPLYFGVEYILVKPYVKGFVLNPMGFVCLKDVSVEPH
ncbi:MAG: hypothetical protein FJ004_08860 [Chloroflexi bacterium]|nr:hypothetical protein [Chloroflexota bacterium]